MSGQPEDRPTFQWAKRGTRAVLGVLVATLLLPASTAGAAENLLFADAFDRPDSGTVGNGWVELDSDSSADARIDDDALGFVADDDGRQPAVSRSFERLSDGVVEWSFELNWTRSGSESTYELGMQLGAGAGSAVDLRWGGPNNGMSSHEGFGYVSGDGTTTQVAVVSGRNVIHVRADLDARTFDLDVDPSDGELEATGIRFADDVAIDTVRLYADSLNGSKFAGREFDDLTVSGSGGTGEPPADGTPPATSSVRATGVDSSGATIEWATDEPADSQVEYGTAPCPCPNRTAVHGDLTTSHAVPLTGLQAGTTYHYRVRSTDAAGNVAVGAGMTFSTPQAPANAIVFEDDLDRAEGDTVGNGWLELESDSADARIDDGALTFRSADDSHRPAVSRTFEPQSTGVVEWRFQLDWARTGSEGTYEVGMQLGSGGDPAVDLRWAGLTSGMSTHEGLGYVGPDNRTTQVATVEGPTGIVVRADLDARTFDLDVDPADGEVEATKVPFSGTPVVDTVRFYANAVNSEKVAGEQFDDLVVERVGAGAPQSPDTTPPTLSGVRADSVGATAATIAWTTDEPADGRVAYDTVACPCSMRPDADPRLVRDHSIRLTGLAPGTTYFYTATSADAAGNATTSATRSFTTPAASGIATVGNRFTLDGAPFDMWGVRTASATQDQAQTDHLIAQLDEYLAHGVNTVSVFYMGARGAHYDPFTPDGLAIDAGHQSRMEQIIRAADARGMVVIVGIFYQNTALGLRDAEAVRNAVRTVTRSLSGYDNVIINVANEQNSTGWSDTESIYDFRDPQAIIELCRVVHEEDPGRLAGSGGYDHTKNGVIGASPDVDVLMFDTSGPDTESDDLHDRFVAAGVDDKPLVNVEMFGGWTRGFERGVFSDATKEEYYEEIAAAASRPGLSVFFHNSPWMQEEPMRYDLAGYGSSADPGIRWYFERVREARAG